MHKIRLDQLLVELGLEPTRSQARQRIRAGRVQVGGRTITRPAVQVARDALPLLCPAPRYVSRGGEKLAAALDELGLDPSGLHCVDAGAGTGGFTDCLLQRGARSVLAIDVGHGQLAPGLRADPRVRCLEGTDVRSFERPAAELAAEPGVSRGARARGLPARPSAGLPPGCEPADLLVGDLAFISITKVWAALRALVRPGGRLLLLVKPQFELDPESIGRSGVVRDPELRAQALERVVKSAAGADLRLLGSCAAPVLQERSNRESFVFLAG